MLQSLRYIYIPTKPQEHLKENEVIPCISYNSHPTFIWSALKYLRNFKFLRKLSASIFICQKLPVSLGIYLSQLLILQHPDDEE